MTLFFEVEKLSEATELGETAAYAMAPLHLSFLRHRRILQSSRLTASFLLEHNLERVGVGPVLVMLVAAIKISAIGVTEPRISDC